jgi:hypothetical protein
VSVHLCQTVWCHIPGDNSPFNYPCEDPKSRVPYIVTIDCNFTGPGGEKRSVRELAASLIKHGGPESEGKKKIGSHTESGWKISTNSYAICGYLCVTNICGQIDGIL